MRYTTNPMVTKFKEDATADGLHLYVDYVTGGAVFARIEPVTIAMLKGLRRGDVIEITPDHPAHSRGYIRGKIDSFRLRYTNHKTLEGLAVEVAKRSVCRVCNGGGWHRRSVRLRCKECGVRGLALCKDCIPKQFRWSEGTLPRACDCASNRSP